MKPGSKILLPLFVLFLGATACQRPVSTSPATVTHTIAFYNLENLFDTEDDPAIDDAEFLPTSESRWTEERYQKKLVNMASVIETLGDADGPELLGVCEIENRKVLEDLIGTATLNQKGYDIIHVNSPDARGIDVGFLYKKSVFRPLSHQAIKPAYPDPEFKTRDILVIKGLFLKDTVTILVNHWPSRRGGSEASEDKRLAAAASARKVVNDVLAANPKGKVLLMGDFNDEPTDKSILQGLQATANPTTANGLLNAMAPLKAQGQGSYKYRSDWNMLDQIILSQGWLASGTVHYVPNSATIHKPENIQETEEKFKGAPLRTYAGKKYLGGYSDHFPVYIHVTSTSKK
jgi:predicted extracellular nuclease